MRETLKVLVPNTVTLGVVTFTKIELALKIGLLLVSIVYTMLKIVESWRKLRAHEPGPEI